MHLGGEKKYEEPSAEGRWDLKVTRYVYPNLAGGEMSKHPVSS